MDEATRDRLLEHETRRRIYDRVLDVPGIHLRELQRQLELALGTLEYHLYQLERQGVLVVRDEGRFKAFFANEAMDRRDRDILYYLRQEMPRRIALEVVNEPGITFRRLASLLPITPPTLSFHLKKLVRAGIIQEESVGREKAYRCPEAERVQRLIVQYRASFLDEIVDRFAAAWLNLE